MWIDNPTFISTVQSAVVLGATFGVITVVLWLERKIAARAQSRIGPYEVGRPHGWAQPLADIFKLFRKEDFIPRDADTLLFKIAPIWVASTTLASVAFFPWLPGHAAVPSAQSLLWVLAFTGLSGLGVVAAGWASANKYALISAMRYIAQVTAFSIPLAAAVLTPAIVYGTLDLDALAQAQPTVGFLLGHPLGLPSLILFTMAALAEGNRTPFDLAEAESELVAGFSIEYSGMRFALFYLGEYGAALVGCALISTVWLGGYRGWIVDGPHWLVLKILLTFIVITLIRWSHLRLRIDQFLRFAWLWMIPASFLLLLFAVWGSV